MARCHGSNTESCPTAAVPKSGPSALTSSAGMHPAEVRKFCPLDGARQALMRSAMNQLQLSARGYHRVLKLARSLADWRGASPSSWRTWPRRFSTGPG